MAKTVHGKSLFRRTLSILMSVLLAASVFSGGLLSASAADGDLPEAGLNYNQYPALKDVYKDYFMMGAAGVTTGTRGSLISYHFDSFTPENEMKPQNIQNVKGTFTFNSANTALNNVNTASPGTKIVGHTLAWHSQSPTWMWDAVDLSSGQAQYGQPGTFDRATALANLNTHIEAVLNQFGSRLQAIDVVNEAIGSGSNWKTAVGNKGEGWALALGSDIIELAFLKAAEIVDANGWDCKLYYNDFSLTGSKAQLVYNMVKELNEKHAGTRPNGKQLIEGIGSQAHGNKNTKVSDIEASIKLFATLPGVSVSFTELDLEWPSAVTPLAEKEAIKQARIYAQLFQVFKKYAAGPANTTNNPKVIERITFWGTDDGNSWKSQAMLFNALSGTTIAAKEALIGVLYPDEYLEANPPSDDDDEDVKKPIDGIHYYNTSNGDSWTGANIILGNNSNAWPWSTAAGDGKVAFTPEKDATYRVSVNYTSMGTSGIRVRWIKDNSNGNYTSKDGQVVSASAPYNTSLNPNQTAAWIPAYFISGMSQGNSYTLVTEIKLDGSLPKEDLVGNIAIRGGGGGNNFELNQIKIEKIGTDGEDDQLLVNWPDGLPKPGTEGVHYYSIDNGDDWAGANIILGNNADAWPWSTAGADGKVAFKPEKGATYRFKVNYTALGTTGVRVRWIKDNDNGNYTSGDAQVVGQAPYSNAVNPNQKSTMIPSYFGGMINTGTYTLTTEITLDGSQPADGLIGNIAIRGYQGGNNFEINWISVEKVGTGGASDELLVNWPDGLDAYVPEPEPEPDPAEFESGYTEPVTEIGDEGLVFTVINASLEDVEAVALNDVAFEINDNNELLYPGYEDIAGTLTSGSVIITLNKYFVKSLDNGSYDLNVTINGDDLSTTFNLNLASDPVEPELPVIIVSADKKLISKGEYFNVGVKFDDVTVNSNAAVLTYTYDSSKFAYRGFTPAEGLSEIKTEAGDGTVSITIGNLGSYGIEDLGSLLFSARENVDFSNETSTIAVDVVYVNKGEDDVKSLITAESSIIVRTTNRDGDFSLIDLSNLVDLFGATEEDDNWEDAIYFDYNENGEIDISDISFLASKIK